MNARTLKIVAVTCLASLGLLTLPTLDSSAGAVAGAAIRVAAWTDAASQAAAGCFSIGQGDLSLPRLAECRLDLILPVLSFGPIFPNAAIGIEVGKSLVSSVAWSGAAGTGAVETEAPRPAAVDHAR